MNPNSNTPWQYKPDSATGTDGDAATLSEDGERMSQPPSSGVVSWTASEYIDHSRGASWYLGLIVGTAILSAVIFFLTRDYFAVGVVAVLGVIVGVFATRKPRQVTYEISSSGLRVGEKSFPYSHFKSFAIIREGNLSSVNLLPLKKLMSPISAYFAPDDEERIVNALGEHLPYEERKMDHIDKLSSKLRF